MASVASCGLSSLLSTCLVLLIFAGMQIYKTQLASSQLLTIIGGYFGSMVFVFLLTAIGNAEAHFFGAKSTVKFFPEVFVSLLMAVVASGMVHRVCTTTCVLFSIVALFCINRISARKYHANSMTSHVYTGKGRKG